MTTPAQFFLEVIPSLPLAALGRNTDEPIVLAFLLRGVATEPLWTAEFGPNGARCAPGEGEGPPLMTVVTRHEDWHITQPRLVAWAERLAERGHPTHGIRGADIARLRDMGGTVDLVATGFTDASGQTRDLVSELWIGRYKPEDPSGRRFSVTVSAKDYDGMLDGSIRPASVFGKGRVRLEGDLGQAMKFGMAAMRLRPRSRSR